MGCSGSGAGHGHAPQARNDDAGKKQTAAAPGILPEIAYEGSEHHRPDGNKLAQVPTKSCIATAKSPDEEPGGSPKSRRPRRMVTFGEVEVSNFQTNLARSRSF
mmetsp:Transcript_60628/g.131415  ORF Transcript_60628/g.131415 Transcript_60628/m.131415 type:complete len:104 (-) Transcript_60628:270-581(-)